MRWPSGPSIKISICRLSWQNWQKWRMLYGNCGDFWFFANSAIFAISDDKSKNRKKQTFYCLSFLLLYVAFWQLWRFSPILPPDTGNFLQFRHQIMVISANFVTKFCFMLIIIMWWILGLVSGFLAQMAIFANFATRYWRF